MNTYKVYLSFGPFVLELTPVNAIQQATDSRIFGEKSTPPSSHVLLLCFCIFGVVRKFFNPSVTYSNLQWSSV